MPFELGVDQLAVWLATVGVLVLIAVALIVLVFRLGGRHSSARPFDILRTRFARGEITKEEFDAARRTLGR